MTRLAFLTGLALLSCHAFAQPSTTCDLSVDRDFDTLPDCVELIIGTDPQSVDSDGDGIADPAELSPPYTDPNNPDSDGDGRCDGSGSVREVCVSGEDLNDNGRRDFGESDPRCRPPAIPSFDAGPGQQLTGQPVVDCSSAGPSAPIALLVLALFARRARATRAAAGSRRAPSHFRCVDSCRCAPRRRGR